MLSLCLLAAFLSMLIQVIGLYGQNGILPISQLLVWREQYTFEIFLRVPSIFWLNSSDSFLQFACLAGAACSAVAAFGICTGPMIFICWFLYLSICNVGQDFTSFQWDSLLLETSLLAVFYAPWKLQEAVPFTAAFKKEKEGSLIFLFLLRLLLFKLMLLAGIVKIASGDPAWRDLTALNYHFETQPLPAPLAWFTAKLPEYANQISTLLMFVIELVFPFMIFLPRPARLTGVVGFVVLQLLIIATGNYAFFNWLTIALSITPLDDQLLLGLFPRTVKDHLAMRVQSVRDRLSETSRLLIPGIIVSFLSINFFIGILTHFAFMPTPLRVLTAFVESFRSFNSYGLFAVMTKKRPEIILEGSLDGKEWREYEFKYKPGNISRMLPSVAPHQPRVDWQMWFAALDPEHVAPWFSLMVDKLLLGRPEVLALFDTNPFPDGPPKMIRAVLYDYHFSDTDGLFKKGQWWRREKIGIYMPTRERTGDAPVISL